MYNIYEEKEFLSLKMFSFIGHGYDLASFQCYSYNRDMFFKTFCKLCSCLGSLFIENPYQSNCWFKSNIDHNSTNLGNKV